MSAYYYDDIPTIQRKQQLLREHREKHIREVLAYCGPTSAAMIHELKWHHRTPVQYLRKWIKDQCVTARSWCNADGMDCFKQPASDHAKAMRACLIEELNTIRAAYRRALTLNSKTIN